jgi:hypothetical protein
MLLSANLVSGTVLDANLGGMARFQGALIAPSSHKKLEVNR